MPCDVIDTCIYTGAHSMHPWIGLAHVVRILNLYLLLIFFVTSKTNKLLRVGGLPVLYLKTHTHSHTNTEIPWQCHIDFLLNQELKALFAIVFVCVCACASLCTFFFCTYRGYALTSLVYVFVIFPLTTASAQQHSRPLRTRRAEILGEKPINDCNDFRIQSTIYSAN